MARSLPSLSLLVVLVSCVGCWEAPWFCHEYECPVYTLVQEYEGFEERYYQTSYWITTDIASLHDDDVTTGFWKLYNFNQGENSENKQIEMTRPLLLSVTKADTGERQLSVSVYESDSDIPEPNDAAIRKTIIPAGTFFVRSFGGIASEDDGLNNVKQLKEDVTAAGMQFAESGFNAAGYDAPWELINRHNEVWIQAL